MKRWFYAGLAAIAVIELAAPLVVETGDAHFWFENLPAWGAISGFVSCVAIVIVSKLLGKLWLARPEHYYDS